MGTTRIRPAALIPSGRRDEPDTSTGGKHGFASFSVIYVNAIGRQPMMVRRGGSFPVGSTIVREKLLRPDAAPELLAVMIKREPGFSPKGGDWEFLILDGDAGRVRSREKTGGCVKCHSRTEGFVFRSHFR